MKEIVRLRVRGVGEVTEVCENVICTWMNACEIPVPADLGSGGYENLIDKELPIAFGRTADWSSEPDEEIDDMADWVENHPAEPPRSSDPLIEQVNQGLISLACKRFSVIDTGLYDSGYIDIEVKNIKDRLGGLLALERINNSEDFGLTRNSFQEGKGGPSLMYWMPAEGDSEIQRWVGDFEDWLPKYPPDIKKCVVGFDPWLLTILFSPCFLNNREFILEYCSELLNLIEDDASAEEQEELNSFADKLAYYWQDPSLPLPKQSEALKQLNCLYHEFFYHLTSEPDTPEISHAEMSKVIVMAELKDGRKIFSGTRDLFPNDDDSSEWVYVDTDVLLSSLM